MQANYAATVKSTLNFPVDRNDGGQFSNTAPERSRQNMRAVEVEIRNARSGEYHPSLEKEGLTLVEHASGAADWSNQEWINNEYVPSCIELVKKMTGAKDAFQVYVPLQRRVNYSEHRGSAPTAGFVHLDQTREIARGFATQYSEVTGVDPNRRAVIYNIWKPLTPPPQDFPLAVADMTSIPEDDHVVGETVEYLGDETIVSPYVTLFPSGRPVYYYYPDMTPDESLLFVGADLEEGKPLGCAHGAFQHPAPVGDTVPRASIEVRVLAFF